MPQAQCADSTIPASNIINVCIVYSIRWREKFSQLKNNLARVKKKKEARPTETSTNKTGTCLTKFFFSVRLVSSVYSTRAPCACCFRHLKCRTTRRQRRRKRRRCSRHQPAKLCTAKRKNIHSHHGRMVFKTTV